MNQNLYLGCLKEEISLYAMMSKHEKMQPLKHSEKNLGVCSKSWLWSAETPVKAGLPPLAKMPLHIHALQDNESPGNADAGFVPRSLTKAHQLVPSRQGRHCR